MNDNTLDNPFWQYACTLYKKPGVADTLLALQDRFDANVPFVLFLVWLGTKEIIVSIEDINRFTGAHEVDTHIIKPLRTIRRSIKASHVLTTEPYEQIKGLELRIEQEIMALLFRQSLSLISSGFEATYCIEHNLKSCILTGDNEQQRLVQQLSGQIR